MLYWKAPPNAPPDSSQQVAGIHSQLHYPLNGGLPQHLVLWWQTALSQMSVLQQGCLPLCSMVPRALTMYCMLPVYGEDHAATHGMVKEQFVFSLIIAGVFRGLRRVAPCTRGTRTRPDPWQLSFISLNHVLEFMIPFYKPEISSSRNRHIVNQTNKQTN